MKTAEFNENYELDRKSKGIRASPKHAQESEIMTADGAPYDWNQTYYFFDERRREIRNSFGLRQSGEHLCSFAFKVVPISKLRAKRDGALSDGQAYFKSQIEWMQKRIQAFELEKTVETRSLKTFLMLKDQVD